MDSFLKMANLQILLLVYILIGFFSKKYGIINKEKQAGFVDFLINIALPAMVFASFNQVITREMFFEAMFIMFVSVGICIFSMILGKVLWRKYPYEKQSVLRYGTLISNAGFAGLPLAAATFGEQGLFYASFSVIPTRIFMWSAGISLYTNADKKTKIKTVATNPAMIAVYVGLIRLVTNFPVPTFIDTAFAEVGRMTTVLSMFIIGCILADIPIKNIFEKSVFYLSFVRLILLPGLTILVFKFMDFNEVAVGATVLLTAMPVGTSTAVLAEKYGADGEFGSKCVFATTVLSLITVPIIIALL